jgi:hypothetical protein
MGDKGIEKDNFHLDISFRPYIGESFVLEEGGAFYVVTGITHTPNEPTHRIEIYTKIVPQHDYISNTSV